MGENISDESSNVSVEIEHVGAWPFQSLQPYHFQVHIYIRNTEYPERSLWTDGDIEFGRCGHYTARSSFLPHRKLRAVIDSNNKNTITITATIKRLPCFRPDWLLHFHYFSNVTSRIRRLVGIVNSGATCFLNSLIQVLFFTNRFRDAVFSIHTCKEDNPESNSVAALQRLFFDMRYFTSNYSVDVGRYSARPVKTLALTRAFHWTAYDIEYSQHDIHELLRIFLDNMAEKMKGTLAQGTIDNLFGGNIRTVTKCEQVEYETVKEETFYGLFYLIFLFIHFADLTMPVKNCTNLKQSFELSFAPEKLCGENMLDTGTHGLQEAIRTTQAVKWPLILCLHLSRFEYSASSGCYVKNTSLFEFPDVLDLSDTQNSVPKYSLFR